MDHNEASKAIELLHAIQAALGTEETGEALVEVARRAHQAEQQSFFPSPAQRDEVENRHVDKEQPAKKKKLKSRSARWVAAAEEAISALDELENSSAFDLSNLEEAIGDLRSVQEEYEDWRDNLPENLQSSALGEKLEEVCGIQIEDITMALTDAIDQIHTAIGEVRSALEEASAIDLPQGFGRD